MKTILMTTVASLMALSAQAAVINSGSYNAKTKSIDLNVSYGGGCQPHTFTLKMGTCLETFPVRCDVKLVEDFHGDVCEAFITEDISLPVASTPLADTYFNGASLIITGDNKSSVNIQLPLK